MNYIVSPYDRYFDRFIDMRLCDIQIGDRHKPLNKRVVAKLAESIEVLGLLNPILVRQFGADCDFGNGPTILIGGLHRLRALQLLGYESTVCLGLNCDDAAAERIQIGLNLIGVGLSRSQKAEHLARHVELMEGWRSSPRADGKWTAPTPEEAQRCANAWGHFITASDGEMYGPRADLV